MFDPNRVKEQLLQTLNWARLHPAEVSEVIDSSRRSLYRGVHLHLQNGRVVKTMEGLSAAEELSAQLKLCPSVGSLQWSPGLHLAAEIHAHELGSSGAVSHKDPKNQQLPTRLKPYCNVKGMTVELMELSGVDSKEIVFELLVDDGLASRSRRKALLSPVYNFVGIGHARHRVYGCITVMILAQSVAEIHREPEPQPLPALQMAQQPAITRYHVEQIMIQDVIQPSYPQVIRNIYPQPLPHQMLVSTPQLQIIPEIPENMGSSGLYQVPSVIPMTPPGAMYHQSVPIDHNYSMQEDVGRNRLLFAKTYNKNVFGGDNEQQCLLS